MNCMGNSELTAQKGGLSGGGGAAKTKCGRQFFGEVQLWLKEAGE